MITGIVLYFLQSAICMAFFYALYWLFLKRDTFFRINRVFLLLTLAASLLIPSLKIPFQIESSSIASNYDVLDTVVLASQQYLSANMLQEVVVTADKHIDWYQYIGIVYFAGMFLLSIRFLKNLIQLFIWSRTNKRIKEDGVQLVVMKDDYPPFSFLNSVYISNEVYGTPEYKSILEHERVHVDQLHTFDLLVIEILTVLFWLNPFVWMYKSSIQEVHEYLADDKVVNNVENPHEYKMHIVNQFAGGELFRLGNNFGQSTLKKRISMLGKIKTPKIALVKLLLLIPICTILVSAFAFTIEEEEKLAKDFSLNELFPSELRLFDAFGSNQYSLDDEEFRFVSGKAANGIKSLERKQNVNPDMVYRVVENMPEFPGGINELKKFIAKNINYPKSACEKGLEGRVFVSFVVDKQGMVKDVQMLRGEHESLNREAVRVIASLPKWTPGRDKTNSVNVAYTVPVNFKLDDFEIVDPIAKKEPVIRKIKNASEYHLKTELQKDEYVMVEKMPQFPGGATGLRKYVAKNIKYPVLAAEQGYEGKVFVRFIVSKDGGISKAHIIQGANAELNREALRVINSMPKWIPGEQHGSKVTVSYTIPIRFALN